MTMLKILGCILLFGLLISLVRFGVSAELGGALRIRLHVGPFRRTVYPRMKRAQAGVKKKPAQGNKTGAAKKRRMSKPTRKELCELIQAIFATLGKTLRRTCKRTRVDPLELCVRFAGDDPADVAQTYGYACAVLWSVMPRLEELFYIPRPSIHLDMDFQAERTSVEGTVGMSLRVCDLFAILLTLAIPLGRWFLRYRRAHANDPVKPEPAETGAAEKAQAMYETEKRTA